MTRISSALLGILGLCGCSHSNGLSVSLHYQSMREAPGPADACEAASRVEVKDLRPNPQVLGERYPEDSPSQTSPVVAVGDVVHWYQDALTSMARKSGLNLEQPGAPVVQIEIRELNVREAVAFNSVYSVRLVLGAKVLPVAGGTPCWANSVEGESKMYGRDASPENHLETLNRAVERASSNLLDQPGLRQALCGCVASTTGT